MPFRISETTAVVAVMSVQPTSAKRTVWQDAGSAASAGAQRPADSARGNRTRIRGRVAGLWTGCGMDISSRLGQVGTMVTRPITLGTR
jgi:hypothetical protein